jgi:vacuolar-type H+-ATPase subunit I/STV1
MAVALTRKQPVNTLKEAVMKANYLNALILIVVATGTAMVAFVGEASRGSEPLQNIFFAFVAAIIAIQVVPALMLVGHLVKGLLVRPAKASKQP